MSWLSSGRADPYSSSLEHLRDELHRAAGLLRAQLLRFRNACPEAQRERFWHLPDADLDTLASDAGHSPLNAFAPADDVEQILHWTRARRKEINGRIEATVKADLRLARFRREFALEDVEQDAVLLALLPALHSTYRRWYGILQHDAAKGLATAGLLVEMIAASPEDYPAILEALGPSGRLVTERLITLGGEDEEPLAVRPAGIDDSVSAFLFGIDRLDARIARIAEWIEPPPDVRTLPLTAEALNRLEMLPNLRAAEPLFLPRLRIEFLGPDAGLAVRAFAAVAGGMGRRTLSVDVGAALASGTSWPAIVDGALRSARLRVGVPIFTGVGALLDHAEGSFRLDYLLRRLSAFPHPAAIEVGTAEAGRIAGGWIPFSLPGPTVAMREKLWTALLAEVPAIPDRGALARSLASAFQLTDSQIRDAWQSATGLARRRNVFLAAIDADDLFAACRRQSSTRLVAFAQRIEPRRSLTLDRDLILPAANKRALYELRSRIRNHTRIHAVMGLGDHMRLGRGVTALFIGGSGTGKTLAAEVLASEQQVDLYRIDLAALVSKWVGETEKNLSRIFADAERANCMLFFDEADAMFGRRGEVREAHDRWANLEVNYLLQRIEEYSGVVILATNLRQNIDDAFQRRIHTVIDFPPPDPASRRAIWERLLPAEPRARVPETDRDDIARLFDFTGGHIRNVVLDACYRAIEEGDAAVTTRHVVASTAREYQKSSRPITRGDFGRFYDWAMEDVVAPPDADRPAGG
jgi:hypothetical protein